MKRSLMSLSCVFGLAAAAAAQVPSTTTIQASTAAVQASTTPVVQASTAPPPASTATVSIPVAPVRPSTSPARGDAWHPGRGPWHKDCDADVARLCPGVTTREQVEQCLSRREGQLSPACQGIRKREGEHRRWHRR